MNIKTNYIQLLDYFNLGHFTASTRFHSRIVKENETTYQSSLKNAIKNENISGLLLSKINYGKELGIQVEIDMNSQLL